MQRSNENSKPKAPSAPDSSAGVEPPKYRSEALLAGGRQAVIEHRGQQYVLRLTSSGKLILTK